MWVYAGHVVLPGEVAESLESWCGEGGGMVQQQGGQVLQQGRQVSLPPAQEVRFRRGSKWLVRIKDKICFIASCGRIVELHRKRVSRLLVLNS